MLPIDIYHPITILYTKSSGSVLVVCMVHGLVNTTSKKSHRKVVADTAMLKPTAISNMINSRPYNLQKSKIKCDYYEYHF